MRPPTRSQLRKLLGSPIAKVNGVPLIYHQIWYAKKTPRPGVYVGPNKYLPNMVAFEKLHPDWTHILWTNDTIDWLLDQPRFRGYRELVDQMQHPIQVADIVRLLILYQYGGIYGDLDITPKQNFEPLLQAMTTEQMVIFHETDTPADLGLPDCIINNFMVARPKGEVLLELVDNIDYLLPTHPPTYSVLYLTGPRAIHTYLFGVCEEELPRASWLKPTHPDARGRGRVRNRSFQTGSRYFSYPRDDHSGWKYDLFWAASKHWIFYIVLVLALVVIILVCLIYGIRRFRRSRQNALSPSKTTPPIKK